MRDKRELAIDLRRSGKSYREIRKAIGVPLATLSQWFKGEEWSREIGKKLTFGHITRSRTRIYELNALRGKRLARMYEVGKKEAVKEFGKMKKDPLFVAGLVAYWGAGDKTSKSLCRLSSADPFLVRLFWLFLTERCKVPAEKVGCWLILPPDFDEKSAKRLWIMETGIPETSFRRAAFIKNKPQTKKNIHGVCSVALPSRFFKEKMVLWLRLAVEEYAKAGMVQW